MGGVNPTGSSDSELVSPRAGGAAWAIVGALATAAAAVRALTTDVFLDGVTYASIARNLAHGEGSFWRLRYTLEFDPFRAHPPLAPWLESWAFRLLGDSPTVERWFGAAAGAATLVLLGFVARAASRAASVGDVACAWPAALFVATPLASWCFANNLLELVLVPLLLLSAWLQIEGVQAKAPAGQLVRGLLSGCAFGLALLTKGPPALFVPAAAPLAVLTVAPGRWRAGLRVVAALWAGAAIVLLAAAAPDPGAAAAFVADYARDHLLPSLAGEREVAPSRLGLGATLALQLAVPGAVAAAAALAGRSRSGAFAARAAARSRVTLFALLAAAATVPLLAFRKQMDWYLLPGVAFAALALGAATEDGAATWLRDRARGATRAAAFAAVVAIALGARFAGAVDVSLDTWVRDAWRARAAGVRPDERYSEYDWRSFRRDLLDRGVRWAPGARVVARAGPSLWRLTAYAERHLGATIVATGWSPHLVVERMPGAPAPAFVNCRRVQGEPEPVRFFAFECRP